VVIVEDTTSTDGGTSLFLAQTDCGTGQSPQKGLAQPPKPNLTSTDGGTGQVPLAGLGKNQRGDLARTDGGASTSTDGGTGQGPTGGLGKDRWEYLPDPASGAPIKTSDRKTVQSDSPDPVPLRSKLVNAQDALRKGGKNGSENVFLLDVASVIEAHKKGSSV